MNFTNPTWIDTILDVFLACIAFAFVMVYWANHAKEEADELIAQGMSEDYDKTSDNFKYQAPEDQEAAINDFRERWRGLVSPSRLRAQIESLEEMRILCL